MADASAPENTQPVPADSTLIDRIVAGVLTQIGGGARERRATTGESRHKDQVSGVPQSPVSSEFRVSGRVVTAETLESAGIVDRTVLVEAKAIVTPAAWDVARERNLRIERASKATGSAKGSPSATTPETRHSVLNAPLLIVVQHTDAVARLWEDLRPGWRREFLGCPDDAAKLAIAELSRGGTSTVVILAEQMHRAACLANRHPRVRAAAIRDVLEISTIRRELKVNTFCLAPTGKSWFELRRLFTALDTGH